MEDRDDDYSGLMGKALRFLSLRPRSKSEITTYLAKHGKQHTAETVLSRLEELGYIDDRKYAIQWIESRDRAKPKSVYVLRHELRAKGIEDSILDDVLTERGTDEEGELTRARNALGKREYVWRNLPVLERKRKLFGFLARRGFSLRIASKVFDEIWPKGYNTGNETGI